jgi:hypothetical protein
VRIGRRIEIDFTGEPDLAKAREIADRLLANPVIEDFSIRVEDGSAAGGMVPVSVDELDVDEPDVGEPVMDEPVMDEPVMDEPVAGEPDVEDVADAWPAGGATADPDEAAAAEPAEAAMDPAEAAMDPDAVAAPDAATEPGPDGLEDPDDPDPAEGAEPATVTAGGDEGRAAP